MGRSEKDYEAFKKRLKLTGQLSTFQEQLRQLFVMHSISLNALWDEDEGGSYNLTGPLNPEQHTPWIRSAIGKEGEESVCLWLYFGRKADLLRIKELVTARMALSAEEWRKERERYERRLQEAPNTPKCTEGYIYVLQAGTRYKIGRTTQPDGRLKANITSSPHDLEQILLVKVVDYKKAEEELHKGFGPKRKKGEWFELEAWELEAIKEYIKQRGVA